MSYNNKKKNRRKRKTGIGASVGEVQKKQEDRKIFIFYWYSKFYIQVLIFELILKNHWSHKPQCSQNFKTVLPYTGRNHYNILESGLGQIQKYVVNIGKILSIEAVQVIILICFVNLRYFKQVHPNVFMTDMQK